MYVGIRSETYPLCLGKITAISVQGTVYPGIKISLINAGISLGGSFCWRTSMEGFGLSYISDSVQCDPSDKQSVVCVWGKYFPYIL